MYHRLPGFTPNLRFPFHTFTLFLKIDNHHNYKYNHIYNYNCSQKSWIKARWYIQKMFRSRLWNLETWPMERWMWYSNYFKQYTWWGYNKTGRIPLRGSFGLQIRSTNKISLCGSLDKQMVSPHHGQLCQWTERTWVSIFCLSVCPFVYLFCYVALLGY